MGGIPLTQIVGSSDSPGHPGGKATVFTNDMKAMLIGAQQTEAKDRPGGYPGLNSKAQLKEDVIPKSIQRVSENGFAELDEDGLIQHEVIPPQEIPFPDVWIPLSDSLRMLAGYGREVKVGDDVVATYATLSRNGAATMINKSDQLVNAGINEARFEREGLLIEGKRTNQVNSSEGTIGWTTNNEMCSLSNTTAPGFGGRVFGSLVGIGNEDRSRYIWLRSYSFSKEVDCTLSAWVYIPEGSPINGINMGSNDLASPAHSTTPVKPGLNRVSHTGRLLEDKTLARCFIRPTVDGYFNISNVDGIELIRAGCLQVEELPLATSYIPTQDSAVTRAADKLTIPRLNNDCVEWYSGSDPITPIVTADTIELVPPAGKLHLRNVRGFFTPLTPAQKAALK